MYQRTGRPSVPPLFLLLTLLCAFTGLRVRISSTAIVLQRAEHRVGVANVAGAVEQTTWSPQIVSVRGVASDVVTKGYDCSA